jgi:hypothetical protein
VNVDGDYVLPLWERFHRLLGAVERPPGVPPYILFGELHVNLNDTDQKHLHTQFSVALASLPADRAAALLGTNTTCLAPHWYDGVTLFMKAFRPWWTIDLYSGRPVLGKAAAFRACSRFVAGILRQGSALPHRLRVPMFIGETGIPFDLGVRHSLPSLTGVPGWLFCRFGLKAQLERSPHDLCAPLMALERTLGVLEANLASFTLWNYTPEHTSAHGDGWNGEDLSIYSPDRRTDPADLHSGGRALPALVRPYARKVAGTPRYMRFDSADPERTFTFIFTHAEGVQAPTEIYVPHYQYPNGAVEVDVSDGEYFWTSRDNPQTDEKYTEFQQQTLFYTHGTHCSEHRITLKLKYRR